MDKILIGAGIGLVGLGVGFLVAAPYMFEIRQPLILGGFLWTVVGSFTALLGRQKNLKQNQKLGALR